ncbi:hypothetical protein [Peribacillus deserti]|uniref:Uncharacterized protein n=1 Tax=Peribacillus deserti TaxID=673318 RepID=A0A2N5M8F9_9BACI|nr:hypothetical protein [Peribacillus deserti]PLT30661.1 hypothetical protein CUU66_06500 [Peribacillus deserti]
MYLLIEKQVDIEFLFPINLIEKQTPERHKKSGSERPDLPFDGDWLMTESVSSKLDHKKSGKRCLLILTPIKINEFHI